MKRLPLYKNVIWILLVDIRLIKKYFHLDQRRLIEDYRFTKAMKGKISYDKFAYLKEKTKGKIIHIKIKK